MKRIYVLYTFIIIIHRNYMDISHNYAMQYMFSFRAIAISNLY